VLSKTQFVSSAFTVAYALSERLRKLRDPGDLSVCVFLCVHEHDHRSLKSRAVELTR